MITDLRSFLKVSCHTKFRFAEREAQCILGECGPLMRIIRVFDRPDHSSRLNVRRKGSYSSKIRLITLFLFVVHLFVSWRLQAVETNETDALTWRKCHLDTET